jgi:transposase
MAAILEDAETNLTQRMRYLFNRLWQEWKSVELEIEEMSGQIELIAQQDAACRRLLTVPGVGPLVSTAMIAAVGNGSAFRKGREFSAWLGLVPKQRSTGGKSLLLGISKRGNPYLRRLFIHGARSAFLHLNREHHSIGAWMNQVEARTHRNVAIVALERFP